MSDIGDMFVEAQQLKIQGDVLGAIEVYQTILAYEPDLVEAHFNLANLLLEQGDEALAHYKRVPEDDELFPSTAFNMGYLHSRAGRLNEAEACYRHAIDIPGARSALAGILSTQAGGFRVTGRFVEGEAKLAEAVKLVPDDAYLWSNLALLHQAAGEAEKAVVAYDKALEIDPDNPDIHYNRATALLTLGEMEDGWRAFEWRLKCGDSVLKKQSFDQPLWDGETPEGKTILLYPEQGLGDAIQFARYALELVRRGAKVVLACKPGLVPLLSSLDGVEVVSIEGDLPPFDVHAPLLSLAQFIDCDPTPYLTALSENRLGTGFKVGLCWRGSPANSSDALRSVPLSVLAPLADCPGVTFYSLQKGQGIDGFPNLQELPGLDEEGGIFMDTASVMAELDLVITVDTAVGHLAGALGRPVWLLLNTAPDWRWMRDRDDTPWYPTMTLWRQTTFGDWDGLVGRVRSALTALVKDRA